MPLLRHRLRNGRLNQIAYSLFLFIRDVAGGDLVGWIDQQLRQRVKDPVVAVERVIGPMRHIFGVSDKVLAMALASLFIGARRVRPRWFRIGVRLIAIDTLVHNFLHRSGILRRFGAEHPYGPRCYEDGGCAGIIRTVASRIDARLFNSAYPANFPRMVQFAIWRFCAADGLNVCNGNMIDDTAACTNATCGLRQKCDHITLNLTKSR